MSGPINETDAGAPQPTSARATPGPYTAERDGGISFVLAGDGLPIADACGSTRTSDECWANAKLIAAALNNFDALRASLIAATLSNYDAMRAALAALLDNPNDTRAQKRAALVLATADREAGQ